MLANATNTIAEGEVLQLMNCNNPDTSEADYMEVIYRKTAKLFEAGTRIGAILAKQDDAIEQALATYGRHLGQAFQLVDDALDYDAKPEELGKNIGDDLAEGKPTLPLIYAMAHGSAAERHMIREAIETGGTRNLTSIQLAIETSGGLRYTAERARRRSRSRSPRSRRCRRRSSATGSWSSRSSRSSDATSSCSLRRSRLLLAFGLLGRREARELLLCRRRLIPLLPLRVRHAVDLLARLVRGRPSRPRSPRRLDEPLAQAVAAEARQGHELDVLHFLVLVEVPQ